MFVSQPASCSKSRSFLFVPPPRFVGDRARLAVVVAELKESAGDTRPVSAGVAERSLVTDGRIGGGRMRLLVVLREALGLADIVIATNVSREQVSVLAMAGRLNLCKEAA